jgi:hypothetical protein
MSSHAYAARLRWDGSTAAGIRSARRSDHHGGDRMTTHLQDLEVHLPDRPGALAGLGQALGRAGVSLEGGGVFTHDGQAIAHYLVDNGSLARQAATEAEFGTVAVRDVVMTRLDQQTPGQLGALARLLGRLLNSYGYEPAIVLLSL